MTQSILADIVRNPQTRLGRALLLLDERGDEIERIWSDLYMVPRCSGEGFYRVRYGGKVESCECPDFEFHGDVEPCKHLLALGIASAKRRAAKKRALA